MSLKRPSKDQPANFEFNSSSLNAAQNIVTKYALMKICDLKI